MNHLTTTAWELVLRAFEASPLRRIQCLRWALIRISMLVGYPNP